MLRHLFDTMVEGSCMGVFLCAMHCYATNSGGAFSRIGPTVAQIAILLPTPAGIGPDPAELGPTPLESGPGLPRFERPTAVKISRRQPQFGRLWPMFGHLRPTMGNVGEV